MNKISISILLIFIFLFLQSCASNPKPVPGAVPVEEHSVSTAQIRTELPPVSPDLEHKGVDEDKKARENSNKDPMVLALLEKAEAKIKSGDKANAAASLERALRLEPKNAMLWHRLALLRLQQMNWQQAINLGKKSNSLAAGDYELQAANWKIIAQANSRAGDKSAAKLAAEMAEKLELEE